jgi:hypothetical protein
MKFYLAEIQLRDNKKPRQLNGGVFYLITYVTPSYDDDALEQLLLPSYDDDALEQLLLPSYDDDALEQLLLPSYDALQPRISPIKVVRSVTEPVSWISLTLNGKTFHLFGKNDEACRKII